MGPRVLAARRLRLLTSASLKRCRHLLGSSRGAIDEALEETPYKSGYDLSRVFFVSLAGPPPAHKIRELLSPDLSPEKRAFRKKTATMYIPGQYGKGKLSGAFLEKNLGIRATMRNFNTLNRVAAMAREEGDRKKEQ